MGREEEMDGKRNFFFCLEVEEKPAVETTRKASARASKLVETRQPPITASPGGGSAAGVAESPHWRHCSGAEVGRRAREGARGLEHQHRSA